MYIRERKREQRKEKRAKEQKIIIHALCTSRKREDMVAYIYICIHICTIWMPRVYVYIYSVICIQVQVLLREIERDIYVYVQHIVLY